MFQNVRFQTMDYVRSRDANEAIDTRAEEIDQMKVEWLQQQDQRQQDKAALMLKIEELDGQIKGKIAQLRDQQSTDSNQKKQNLSIFADQVTKEMVEKLNKILESKSP